MVYYYLAAQLPYLVYGQAAPAMTTTHFKTLCQTHLSGSDYKLLSICTLNPLFENHDTGVKSSSASGSKLINEWNQWERALRLNLARFRAQRLKREASAVDAPGSPTEAVTAAKAALALESPLEAELFLDEARWKAIEAFQGLDTFGTDAMYAYFLKLQILERRALFNTENGFTEYKGLYTAVLTQYDDTAVGGS
ncbi:hypothetical protein ACYULU_13855 [Breznakiellaceae bacterium SP9]